MVILIKNHVDLLSFLSLQLHPCPRGQENLRTVFFHLPWGLTSTCQDTLCLSHFFLKPTTPDKVLSKAISSSDSTSSGLCQIRETILWELSQCQSSPYASKALECLAALLNGERLSLGSPFCHLQLILELHGFELHGSTCMQTFFQSTHSSTDLCSSNPYCSRANSVAGNSCVQRADCGILELSTVPEVSSPNLCIVQGLRSFWG